MSLSGEQSNNIGIMYTFSLFFFFYLYTLFWACIIDNNWILLLERETWLSWKGINRTWMPDQDLSKSPNQQIYYFIKVPDLNTLHWREIIRPTASFPRTLWRNILFQRWHSLIYNNGTFPDIEVLKSDCSSRSIYMVYHYFCFYFIRHNVYLLTLRKSSRVELTRTKPESLAKVEF